MSWERSWRDADSDPVSLWSHVKIVARSTDLGGRIFRVPNGPEVAVRYGKVGGKFTNSKKMREVH